MNNIQEFKLAQQLVSLTALTMLCTITSIDPDVILPVKKSSNSYEFSLTPSSAQSLVTGVNFSGYATCTHQESDHTADTEARMLDGGAMQRALNAINTLRQLNNGWNGSDSISPPLQTLADAEAFARLVFDAHAISEPIISPANDGEINFFWKTEFITLDLGFFGDGSYSYYAKTSDGIEYYMDDALASTDLPEEIIRKLLIT